MKIKISDRIVKYIENIDTIQTMLSNNSKWFKLTHLEYSLMQKLNTDINSSLDTINNCCSPEDKLYNETVIKNVKHIIKNTVVVSN